MNLLVRSTWSISSYGRSVESNSLKLMIIHSLFGSLALPVAIIVAFWKSFGLSVFEMLLLESIFAIGVVLLEVPSGYFADLYGRRSSIIWGSVMLVFGETFYAISYGFNGFLCAELMFAGGVALISGADQALLYDSLAQEDRAEEEYQRTFGRIMAMSMLIGALNFILGGLIATHYGLRTPFLVAIPGLLLMVAVALSIEEPDRTQPAIAEGHLGVLLDVAKGVLIENRYLRWILISSGVLFAFRQSGFWLYQPYFERCGIGLEWNGYILAASAASGSFFVATAHRFEERWNIRSCVWTLALCVGLGFILMSQVASFWGPIFIVLHQFARGFSMVIFSHHLNSRLNSETRATALSVRGMSDRIFYALLLLPAGWLTDELGVLSTFGILGIGVAALGFVLALLGPNENE